jgi:hypothetical protein
MTRLLAVLTGTGLTLALAVGCSGRYEYRLEKTLDQMKYQQRLDQFLNPAETGAFQELGIFLRTPMPMQKAQQNVGLPSVDPAQYEIVSTFVDSASRARLHVLSRVKRPKKPPAKKGEAPPVEVPRGEFVADVLALLAQDLGNPEATAAAPKADKKGINDFRKLVFKDSSGNDTQVYFSKVDIYDTALVWVVPPAAEKGLATGRDLALEVFSVGPRALNKFRGGTDDDFVEGAAVEGAGQPF